MLIAAGRSPDSFEVLRAKRLRASSWCGRPSRGCLVGTARAARSEGRPESSPIETDPALDLLGEAELWAGDSEAARAAHDAARSAFAPQLSDEHPYLIRNATLRNSVLHLGRYMNANLKKTHHRPSWRSRPERPLPGRSRCSATRTRCRRRIAGPFDGCCWSRWQILAPTLPARATVDVSAQRAARRVSPPPSQAAAGRRAHRAVARRIRCAARRQRGTVGRRRAARAVGREVSHRGRTDPTLVLEG